MLHLNVALLCNTAKDYKGKAAQRCFLSFRRRPAQQIGTPVLSPNDSGSIDPQKDDILKAKRHASGPLCKNQMPKWHITFEKFRNRLGHTEVSAHTDPAKH